MTQDLVEVQSDVLLVDQAFDLALQRVRQDPHQSLGSEPVLGALFVVSLGHVAEHIVASQVDIVDDLAQVGLEVRVSQILQIVQVRFGNFTLPLQFALAVFADGAQLLVGVHISREGLFDDQILSGGGDLASGQGKFGLVFVSGTSDGGSGLLAHVCSEADHVEVLGDVVHDLGLEESLSGVIHDLVAELGLGDVFSQLFDASALGRGAIFVNDLIAFPLGSLNIKEHSFTIHFLSQYLTLEK